MSLFVLALEFTVPSEQLEAASKIISPLPKPAFVIGMKTKLNDN